MYVPNWKVFEKNTYVLYNTLYMNFNICKNYLLKILVIIGFVCLLCTFDFEPFNVSIHYSFPKISYVHTLVNKTVAFESYDEYLSFSIYFKQNKINKWVEIKILTISIVCLQIKYYICFSNITIQFQFVLSLKTFLSI